MIAFSRTCRLVALSVISAIAAAGFASQPAQAEKRHIVVTAVEPKGGANVEKEPFPTASLPEGGGYVIKKPNDEGRWEVAVYVFEPRQIFVDEGDEVTLEFVGINGSAHPIAIEAYGQSFELKRGHVHKATFTADKPGRHSIVCSAHLPTMVSELIVAPKK
jgi:plastocyanin